MIDPAIWYCSLCLYYELSIIFKKTTKYLRLNRKPQKKSGEDFIARFSNDALKIWAPRQQPNMAEYNYKVPDFLLIFYFNTQKRLQFLFLFFYTNLDEFLLFFHHSDNSLISHTGKKPHSLVSSWKCKTPPHILQVINEVGVWHLFCKFFPISIPKVYLVSKIATISMMHVSNKN